MTTIPSTLIAIDPGASGGIAILHNNSVHVTKMPETPADLCDIIRSVGSFDNAASLVSSPRCYLEQVGGYVGGDGQPGSAMFRFGEGFGIIKGILVALKIPFVMVRPQKWQKSFSIPSAGLQRVPPFASKEEKKAIQAANAKLKAEHKRALKVLAQSLFPSLHITLDTCDAVLILEYARKTELLGRPVEPQTEMSL